MVLPGSLGKVNSNAHISVEVPHLEEVASNTPTKAQASVEGHTHSLSNMACLDGRNQYIMAGIPTRQHDQTGTS